MGRSHEEGTTKAAESQPRLEKRSDDDGALDRADKEQKVPSESASFREMSKSDQRGFLMLTLLCVYNGANRQICYRVCPLV